MKNTVPGFTKTGSFSASNLSRQDSANPESTRLSASAISASAPDPPNMPCTALQILGQFQVDLCQLFIISFSSHTPSEVLAHPDSPYTEVERFEVEGQICAIVKLESPPSHQSPANQSPLDLATLLTDRELQIATLVATGRSNKQIAHQLHISEWTVSTHLRRTFIKLGVDSRAAMVYQCAGLIQQLRGHAPAAQTP